MVVNLKGWTVAIIDTTHLFFQLQSLQDNDIRQTLAFIMREIGSN